MMQERGDGPPVGGPPTGTQRLLVTGVSGLLGLNLAWQACHRLPDSLLTRSFQVTGVLRGSRAIAAPDATPFEVITADLTQPGQVERVMELSQPDLIINCAALAEVDQCEMRPEEAFQVNALLPEVLARAAARHGVRLVHISTDAVFDGQRGEYTECDEPHPINTYASTKLEGERRVSNALPEALIARVNFYGWSWQGQRSLAEYFFNSLSAGIPVLGFTDLIFCPLLVNDLAEILLRMVERNLSGIYHVVSAEAQDKFSFGRMLAREFGLDENLIAPASYRAGNLKAQRAPLLSLRCEKLVESLGGTGPDALPIPGQAMAMRRFADLYRQGYARAIRAALVKPTYVG